MAWRLRDLNEVRGRNTRGVLKFHGQREGRPTTAREDLGNVGFRYTHLNGEISLGLSLPIEPLADAFFDGCHVANLYKSLSLSQ